MIPKLTSAGLQAAMDANMAAFWRPYGKAGASIFSGNEANFLVFTGFPVALFNGVFVLQPDTETIRKNRDAMQVLLSRDRLNALWWQSPEADAAAADLSALGLEPAGETPAMAVELAQLPGQAPQVPGLRIIEADTPARRSQWAALAGEGTFSSEFAPKLAALERQLSGAEYEAQRQYIGLLNGAPVACSAMILARGVAGIYAVATLPAARGKGIGTAMTVAPLLRARDMGFHVGVLQSSSLGRPVYERIGFSVVAAYRNYLQRG